MNLTCITSALIIVPICDLYYRHAYAICSYELSHSLLQIVCANCADLTMAAKFPVGLQHGDIIQLYCPGEMGYVYSEPGLNALTIDLHFDPLSKPEVVSHETRPEDFLFNCKKSIEHVNYNVVIYLIKFLLSVLLLKLKLKQKVKEELLMAVLFMLVNLLLLLTLIVD